LGLVHIWWFHVHRWRPAPVQPFFCGFWGSAPRWSRCNLGTQDSPLEFLPTLLWSASLPCRCSDFPFQFHVWPQDWVSHHGLVLHPITLLPQLRESALLPGRHQPCDIECASSCFVFPEKNPRDMDDLHDWVISNPQVYRRKPWYHSCVSWRISRLFGRNCLTELPNQITKLNCQTKLSNWITKLNCQTRLPNWIAEQNCQTELPNQIAESNYQTALPN
jgi:hypothetical protein